MTVIICVDDTYGISFFNKRTSRDRLLCEHIAELARGKTLWCRMYSKMLFDGICDVSICEAPNSIKGDDLIFWELDSPDLSKADRVILCRWNRHYPADRFFDSDSLMSKFTLSYTEEIVGSSHEKITIEHYIKRS